MILTRIGVAAVVSGVLACGGTSDDKSQQPVDTTSQAGTFSGAFGDSAKPDTTRPQQPVDAGASGRQGGNPKAGTTDTGMVAPAGPGTTDTASATTRGTVDARARRPAAGVYDTALAPPPPSAAPLRKTRQAMRSAGVHR